jgi:hypothetical protein
MLFLLFCASVFCSSNSGLPASSPEETPLKRLDSPERDYVEIAPLSLPSTPPPRTTVIEEASPSSTPPLNATVNACQENIRKLALTAPASFVLNWSEEKEGDAMVTKRTARATALLEHSSRLFAAYSQGQ